MMVTSLVVQLARRTAEFAVNPVEGHVFATPPYIKDLYERPLGWFGKHVRGVEGSATGGP